VTLSSAGAATRRFRGPSTGGQWLSLDARIRLPDRGQAPIGHAPVREKFGPLTRGEGNVLPMSYPSAPDKADIKEFGNPVYADLSQCPRGLESPGPPTRSPATTGGTAFRPSLPPYFRGTEGPPGTARGQRVGHVLPGSDLVARDRLVGPRAPRRNS